MAVNARATWQLIRSFASQYESKGQADDESDPQSPDRPPKKLLRILSITSDHTAGNLPYGASKGAMDRIVLAAAQELAGAFGSIGSHYTSNVINPMGATGTGWVSAAPDDDDDDMAKAVLERNLQPRLVQPSDVANLVSFLCPQEGQWINGQVLYSDGGLRRS